VRVDHLYNDLVLRRRNPMTQTLCVVVKCPDCFEARVSPEQVTLRHCLDNETWSYRFTCPECRLPAVSSTGEPAARAAMEAGCPIEIWRLPAELLEHNDNAPALTISDILDLHEEMEQPDWLDVLARAGEQL
jgi:hypothetical protein